MGLKTIICDKIQENNHQKKSGTQMSVGHNRNGMICLVRVMMRTMWLCDSLWWTITLVLPIYNDVYIDEE